MEQEVAAASKFSLILVALFITIFTAIFLFLQTVLHNKKRRTPPGPWKLPIIGNLHQMTSGNLLPHHRLRDLATKYGPLMHLQLGEVSTVVVSSAELAKEFLQTNDFNFGTRPYLPSAHTIFYQGRDVAFGNGKYWKHMRKICVQELLAANRVKSLVPIIEQEVHQLVTSIGRHQSSAVNIDGMLVSLGYSLISRAAFGKHFNSFFLDVLLNHSLHQDSQIPVTNNDIKAVLLDILIAGSDTSSSTIEWVLAELMRSSRVMKKVQKEVRDQFDSKGRIDYRELEQLQYLKLVIKETLSPREAREAAVIHGYQIPAKTRIIINAWAIARDQHNWREPEKFLPERFVNVPSSITDYTKGLDFSLIPFGSGRRICPGVQFGMAFITLCLANLLYHFDWKLPSSIISRTLDMSEEFGIAVKKEKNLVLIPIPYHPKGLCK
ncbi:Cytochrome P450 726A27 [Linum grandiflorum]